MANPDELKKVFDQLDSNGDRKILVLELDSVFKAMGTSYTETELSRVLEEVDTDRDGYINIDEFSTLCCSSSSAAEIRDAFDLYDQDKNGLISAAELHQGMDPYSKEEMRQMKQAKEHLDMLGYVADAQYGMPTRCPCGGRILDEIAAEEDADKLPGKRYLTCIHFKDDGLHFRQPWVTCVEEELTKLNRRGDVAEERNLHAYNLLRAELKKLKDEIAELKMEVAELQRVVSGSRTR